MSVARRDVHGIFLLNKPAGLSSNQALQIVKRLYAARKAGHTGSLDPLATGLLPICLGEATKFAGFLLDADKAYTTTLRLGVRTDTGDAEGRVTATAPVHVTREQLDAALAHLRGEILQTPPMYSALKHRGQTLYTLARQGLEVERTPRRVTIHQLTLVQHEDAHVVLNVRCSKGTYIRVLAEDIGHRLGCGAHVRTLHRTATGPFTSAAMMTLEALRAAAERDFAKIEELLLPPDSALTAFPSVTLSAETAQRLQHGQIVSVEDAPVGSRVRVYGSRQEFLGIGEMKASGSLAPYRLVACPVAPSAASGAL